MPRAPGPFDGVGDYAVAVARKLHRHFGYETIFVAAKSGDATNIDGFEIRSLGDRNSLRGGQSDRVILHYVNYGYHERGLPFALLRNLRELRQNSRARFLTVFHELYASGPPWKSSFWLQPLQKRIAKRIAQLSNVCIVSSNVMTAVLKKLEPRATILVHPVLSNFGEPSISTEQIAGRDPQRWIICGGTALVERSLRSFRRILNTVPSEIAPRRLEIIGGDENTAVRSAIVELPIEVHYQPNIAVSDASEILSDSSFMWLDYFYRSAEPTVLVLKSTAFAAACAHGVIPILPERGTEIFIDNDRLPGPFFIEPRSSEAISLEGRAKIATLYYEWYHRHSSSEILARSIANALR